MKHRLAFLLVLIVTSGSAPASGAGLLCGTVRDGTTAAPVPMAGIFLYQSNAYTGLHTATDIDGAYCIADIPPGTYDLQVRVNNFETAWMSDVVVEDVTTSVDISSGFPARLNSPWPNPAGSTVHLGFAIGAAGDAELSVYDVRGRRLHFWSGHAQPGELTFPWNFIDESGRPASSGVYFVRLRVGDRVLSRSFVRVR